MISSTERARASMTPKLSDGRQKIPHTRRNLSSHCREGYPERNGHTQRPLPTLVKISREKKRKNQTSPHTSIRLAIHNETTRFATGLMRKQRRIGCPLKTTESRMVPELVTDLPQKQYLYLFATNTGDACHASSGLDVRAQLRGTYHEILCEGDGAETIHQRTPQKLAFSKFHP